MQEFLAYLLVTILCVAIMTLTLQLWKADLRVPFSYQGDAISGGADVKSIIDNGWYLNNSFSGAPGNLQKYDFPQSDHLHYLIIKFLALFSSDYALLMNLFFLLTFPLTAIASLFVFRQSKIPYPVAIAVALLPPFLLYHYLRGVDHLMLSGYYAVPLAVLVMLWTLSKNPPFLKSSDGRLKLDLLNYRSITSLVICLIIASTGIYYAFFAVLLLLVAGIGGSFQYRRWSQLLASLILVVIIGATLFVNLFPSINYIREHGRNTQTAFRQLHEVEEFSLKVTQLVIPQPRFGLIPYLSKKGGQYYANMVVPNEAMEYLGFIGVIGLFLLFLPLFRRSEFFCRGLLTKLSLLNIMAILIGTIGGFSSLIALFGSPQIRAYNRMSIFIAFFAFFAVALLLEGIYRSYIKTTVRKITFCVGLIFIVTIGIADQTAGTYTPSLYKVVKKQYMNDDKFVKQIEAKVPKESMIFQLPYVPYPEFGPINKMPDYEHFKAYLHSKELRWSYGAMKGRDDGWQKKISRKPVREILASVRKAGFKGIYINRLGYVDNGAVLETELKKLLRAKPMLSDDKNLMFFDITK